MARRLTLEEKQRMRALVAAGTPRRQVAAEFGLNPTTVQRHTRDLPTPVVYNGSGEVPVEPLAVAVQHAVAAGDSWTQIAFRAGWRDSRGEGWGDGTTLRRRLGLVKMRSHGRATFTQMMRPETAARIVRAIGRDPVEFGI